MRGARGGPGGRAGDPRPAHRRVRRAGRGRPRARTCSRRPRTSSRRRRSTTGSGSSRSRRATSTSTDSRAPLHPARRLHRPAAGRQRARGRPRRRRPRRRDHARLRARDAAVGDDVRAVTGPGPQGADYRNRIFMMTGEIPFAGHPSLGTAAAVARARGERERDLRPADASRAAADRRRARRDCARASRCSRSRRRSAPELDPAEVLGRVGLSAADADPRLPCQVVSTGRAAGARLRGRRRRRSAAPCPTTTASARCSATHEAITLYLAARRPGAGPRARALVPGAPRDGRGPGDRLGRRPAVRVRGRAHRRASGSRSTRASRWGAPSVLRARDRGRPRAGGRRRRDPGRGHRPSGRLTDSGAPICCRSRRSCRRDDHADRATLDGTVSAAASNSRTRHLPDNQRWYPSCPGVIHRVSGNELAHGPRGLGRAARGHAHLM